MTPRDGSVQTALWGFGRCEARPSVPWAHVWASEQLERLATVLARTDGRRLSGWRAAAAAAAAAEATACWSAGQHVWPGSVAASLANCQAGSIATSATQRRCRWSSVLVAPRSCQSPILKQQQQ